MMNKMKAAPIALGIAVAAGLVGCEGNSTTTTISGGQVVTPIVIDKAIEALDWDQNNEVEMASYAFRSVARNSMLATLYSGYSSIFTSFITLVQATTDEDCYVSGSIDAVEKETACKNLANEDVSCTLLENNEEVANPDAVISIEEQSAIFYQCQDGVSSGSYFNGPLRLIQKHDYSVSDVYKTTTTLSAESMMAQQGENGKFVLNDNDEVVMVQATEFLMQSEFLTFYMSHDYNLEVTFDKSTDRLTSRNISECTTADKTENDVFTPGTSIVTQELMASDFVSGLQEPNPQFPYTEFTNLNLIATNSNFRCEDVDGDAENGNEALRFDTDYSLASQINSKQFGGDTQFDWANLNIPSNQINIEGTITLTHTNQDSSSYIVNVVFDGEGNLSVNGGPSMTIQELLDESKVAE